MKMSREDTEARLAAEVALLGAAFMDLRGVVVPSVAPMLDGVKWANPAHRAMWGAMVSVTMSGRPVDPVTIRDALGADIEQAGGLEYILTLAGMGASTVNVEHHAKIIASLSRKSAFIDAMRSKAIEVMAADSDGWMRPAGEAIGAMSTAMVGADTDTRRSAREIADEMVQRWQNAEAGIFTGQRLGWHPHGDDADYKDGQGHGCGIDVAFGGVEDGWLLVLGARPKQGKTTLATTIMGNLLDRGLRVLGWFGEEPLPDIASRIIHRKARRVFADRARRGVLCAADGDHDRLIQAVNRYREYNLHLIDGRVTTKVGGVIAEALRIRAVHGGLDLIVIDQATLIDPSHGRYSKLDPTRFYDICAELKQAAPRLGCPVLLLSQVKQEVDKRPNKRPTSSDMHGADAFLQYADRLMMLYRWRAYDEDAEPVAELRTVANRHGPTGCVYMQDCTQYGHFLDVAPDTRRMIESMTGDGPA